MEQKNIRNFSIIAHIDHGKSTLADRLLEKTEAVEKRNITEQMLDSMDLEKERGITIKSRAVRMQYKSNDGELYELNLIDTPGHVDFTYEVSRSLAACEGAILVVDATQGVEAQTLANVYLALENDLEVIPVINKIDLPNADPEWASKEVEDIIGLDCEEAPRISAKEGINIDQVLEAVVTNIPAPNGDVNAPLKALIFDSYYDNYKGVVIHVCLKDGSVKVGDEIYMMATQKKVEVVEVGYFDPELHPCEMLSAGEVGYITASIKNVRDTRVGDTVTNANNKTQTALPGYRQVNPMVYCGIYPADGSKYDELKEALYKLQINDASLMFEPETSLALGFGFRCGFLGLLHMEIIQERIDREYNLEIVTTAPSVVYNVKKVGKEKYSISNPSDMPPVGEIEYMEEPIVDVSVMTPTDYVGSIMELCQDRRGTFINMEYLDANRVNIHYEMPLNEIIYDFFDALKSRTRGFASFDYVFKEYRQSKLVRLDLLLNGDLVDAFSLIVHESKSYQKGRTIAIKLKEHIPKHMFEIPIQAAIGNKVIARETVKAMRKDVTAKCYGGDITRKRKLLEKQKEGKKRMRQVGSVEVPQEAFTAVLKLD